MRYALAITSTYTYMYVNAANVRPYRVGMYKHVRVRRYAHALIMYGEQNVGLACQRKRLPTNLLGYSAIKPFSVF